MPLSVLSQDPDQNKCAKGYKSVIRAFEGQNFTPQNIVLTHKLFFGGELADIYKHAGLLRVGFSNDENQLAPIGTDSFSAPAKKHAREQIRAMPTISPEVLSLINLDEIIDEQNEVKKVSRDAKKFYKCLAEILQSTSPKFDILKREFKEQMIPAFIFQLKPWNYDSEIHWLEDLIGAPVNQGLFDKFEQELHTKYLEISFWFERVASLLGALLQKYK
ncbi:MAG TPA: hypothetical protein DIC42_03005 [Holosporales bacterium]|nr:hypothetical protein [Holosporales bacterium]